LKKAGGIPADIQAGITTAKTWAGGTTYRIPSDAPGIVSLTIHNASTPADERS
jgi:hypothetical protein